MNLKKKLLIALVVYIVSFVVISRISESILKNEEMHRGYLFLPFPPQVVAQSAILESINELMRVIYFPLWKIDLLITKKGPISIPLFELNSKTGSSLNGVVRKMPFGSKNVPGEDN